MKTEFDFTFGSYSSRVVIREQTPPLLELTGEFINGKRESKESAVLVVCDTHTQSLAGDIARRDAGGRTVPMLVLESGENSKTWESVEKILRAGRAAGLGRDGLFIGVGGGVIGDLTAFAASIYMRGARLCLVSTTLLGMVDASLGGKTGIDLLGLKNMAGTFYPAGLVVLPLAALDTLPESEWKSGMAELIKHAVLDSEYFFTLLKKLIRLEKENRNTSSFRQTPAYRNCLMECISLSVAYKGRIVEADPRETGKERPLLNLGHTFGHALEGAAGLGAISHGEAVAWGMARAAELGTALGITPPARAKEITEILDDYGYETRAPHPLVNNANCTETLINAMGGDKKQINGRLRFIVPGAEGARIVSAADTPGLDGSDGKELLRKIISGQYRN